MSTHIRILGWLLIIRGVLRLLAALGIFASSFLGGLFSGHVLGALGGIVGGAVLALLAFLSGAAGLAAGTGLLRRQSWARTLGILISIFSLIEWPVGTIIGVYGLWVLLSSEGAAQFHLSSDF